MAKINKIDASFGVCPECGYIHPPDPSGRCPIKHPDVAKNKEHIVQAVKPIITNIPSPVIKSGIDFTDMTNSLADIASTQIKMKNISDENEIEKVKQYVIIEVTKAFERYPYKQL